MPPPKFTSPFQQISLFTDEREMLIRTANELVNQAQEKYEWFLWQERERLDYDRWRLVKERDDMSVYVDRRLADETGNRDMQMLLTTGSIAGTLNDAMYGILNHTTDAMKIKSAYAHDTLLDSAVLETILDPTPELPFQSLTLRWFAKGLPLSVRALTKKHADKVSIEASGVRKLYDGVQIGFHLAHSVVLAEAPPLPQFQRSNFSTCSFYRQMTPNRVQVYKTTYVQLNDSIVVSLLVKSIADAMISEAKITHVARMKKLAWMMKQSKKAAGETVDVSADKNAACHTCGSKCPSVFKCTSGCAVCSKPVCRRCRVKNEMVMLGTNGEVIKTKVRVCNPCMKTVDQLDAAVVAQHEAVAAEDKCDDSGLKDALVMELRRSSASSAMSTMSTDSGNSM